MIRRSYSHNNNKQDSEISQLKMVLQSNNIQKTKIDQSNKNQDIQKNIYQKNVDMNSSFADYLMQDIDIPNQEQIIDKNEPSIIIPTNEITIDNYKQKSNKIDIQNLSSQHRSSTPPLNTYLSRVQIQDYQYIKEVEGSRKVGTAQSNCDNQIKQNQQLSQLDEIQQQRKKHSQSVNSKCVYKIFPNIAVKLPSITPMQLQQQQQMQNLQNQTQIAKPYQLGYSLDQHQTYYNQIFNQQKQYNKLSTEPHIKQSSTVNTAPNGTKQYIDKSFEEIIQRISTDNSNMNRVKQKQTDLNFKKSQNFNDNSLNEISYENMNASSNEILNSKRRMLLKYKNKSQSRNRFVNISLNQNISPLNMSQVFKPSIQQDKIMNYINCKFNQVDKNQTNLISKEELIDCYEINPNPLHNYNEIEQFIQNHLQIFVLDLVEKQTERAGLLKFNEFQQLLNEFFTKNINQNGELGDNEINIKQQMHNNLRNQLAYMSIQEQETKRQLSKDMNNSQNRLKNIYTHRLFSAQKTRNSKNEDNCFSVLKDNSFNITYGNSSQSLRKSKRYKQNKNNQSQLNILFQDNQISERQLLNTQFNQINNLNQVQIQNINQNKILNNLHEVNLINLSRIEQQKNKFKQEEQLFFTEQKVRAQSAIRSRNPQLSYRKKINTQRYDRSQNDKINESNQEIKKFNLKKNESYLTDDSNQSSANEQSSRNGMIKLNQINYNKSNKNLKTGQQFVKPTNEKSYQNEQANQNEYANKNEQTNQNDQENSFAIENNDAKQNKGDRQQNNTQNKLLNEIKITDSLELRNMSRESESTRISLNCRTQEKFHSEGSSLQAFFNKNSNIIEQEKEEINMINKYNQLYSSQEFTKSSINTDKSMTYNYKPIYGESNGNISHRYRSSQLIQEEEEQESKLAFEDQKLSNLLKKQKVFSLNRQNFNGVSGSLLLKQYNSSFKKDSQEKKNPNIQYIQSNPIIEQNEPTLTEPNEQSIIDQNEQKNHSKYIINDQEEEDLECTFRPSQQDKDQSEKKQHNQIYSDPIKIDQKDSKSNNLSKQNELQYLNTNINSSTPPNNIETPQYLELKKIEIKESFKKEQKFQKENLKNKNDLDNNETNENEYITLEEQILNDQTAQIQSNLNQISQEVTQHLAARRSIIELKNHQENCENNTEQDICDNIEIQEGQIAIQPYSSKYNNQSSINSKRSDKTNQKNNLDQDNIENNRINNLVDVNSQNFLNKKEVKVMKKGQTNKTSDNTKQNIDQNEQTKQYNVDNNRKEPPLQEKMSILNDITINNNSMNINNMRRNSIQQGALIQFSENQTIINSNSKLI